MATVSATARESARRDDGRFGVQPAAESDVALGDLSEPPTPSAPAESPSADHAPIGAYFRNQFLYGDCVHLAHALADQNPGWGVVVVGEAEMEDPEDPTADFTEHFWDTGTIQHAWAQRPDGALVDITGVHHLAWAQKCSEETGYPLWSYSGPRAAEEVDHVWGATVMEPAGDIDAGEAAAFVAECWGQASPGYRVPVDESLAHPDDESTEDPDDYPDDDLDDD